MAKVNLKDATKGLVEEASEILEKATAVRKAADSLFDTLKKMDQEYNRQKDEEAQRRKQQEQLKAQSSHTKAFTMLDEDEKQLMEAAMAGGAESQVFTPDGEPAGAEKHAPETAPKAEAAEPAPEKAETVWRNRRSWAIRRPCSSSWACWLPSWGRFSSTRSSCF